jgi:AraC-like DNA-binding protein
VRRVAPGHPQYRRYERLGLETVVYRGPLPRMPAHAHAQYQLTLYAGEPRRFNVAGRAFTGDTRTSVIIQSGELHGSTAIADEHTALRTFYVDVPTMEEAAGSIWHHAGTVAFREPRLADPDTVAILHQAHRALDEGGLEAEVAFCAAIEQLVRRHATPTGTARALPRADARMDQVRDLLVDRLADNVRLDDLAEAAHVSRFHLIRLFRQRYGVTPFAYQRFARVERARDALRHGESLAVAAAAYGFADQSHLGRAFRAVMGATPGQYRESYNPPRPGRVNPARP